MTEPRRIDAPEPGVCVICGSHFAVKPSNVAKRKTCSRTCQAELWRRRHLPFMKECAVCGQPFKVRPDRFNKSKYCSRKCQGAAVGARRKKISVAEFLASMSGVEGCWEWPLHRDKAGYGKTKVNGKPCRTHRVAYELVNGPLPDGMMACHRCDNPSCCRPDHLFAGTADDNAADCKSKGRNARGERSANHKLTDDDVRAIRTSSLSAREIADVYGVGHSVITRIRRRERWSHIE